MQEHTCVKWSHFRACYQNFDTTFNLNACEHVKKHSYKTFALPWKQDLMLIFLFFAAICMEGCNSEHGSCEAPGECR